ncbi:MAG: HEAT repeat domain-containing protein [Elusimicrobia bacterium]|nr:HEAT repeat domain-containing protein [Elusimicrobiota bacterium]
MTVKGNALFWLTAFLVVMGLGTFAWPSDFSKAALGATGAQFLELPVGARGIAMGAAQAAAVNDATALYYNPAGLAGINGGNAVFMHSLYFQGIAHSYMAVAQRLGRLGTMGISAQYLTPGSLEEIDNTGKPTGDKFSPSDLALTLGYGGRPIGNLELGLGIKYISSKIQATTQTAALDMGARYRIGKFSLAGSVANLGQGLQYRQKRNDLPLTARLGTSLEIGHCILALDGISSKSAPPFFGFGAEYSAAIMNNLTALGRIGYNSRTLSSKLGSTSGMSAGGGLSIGSFLQVDYAFVPFGDLGATHRISLSLRFGTNGSAAPQALKAAPLQSEPELKPAHIQSDEPQATASSEVVPQTGPAASAAPAVPPQEAQAAHPTDEMASVVRRFKSPGWRDRLAAVRQFEGFVSSDKAAPLLSKLVNDPSPAVRAETAHILGKTANSNAVGPLVRLSRDKNPKVRAVAAAAMGELGNHGGVNTLKSLTKDSNETVKKAARKALKMIGK